MHETQIPMLAERQFTVDNIVIFYNKLIDLWNKLYKSISYIIKLIIKLKKEMIIAFLKG